MRNRQSTRIGPQKEGAEISLVWNTAAGFCKGNSFLPKLIGFCIRDSATWAMRILHDVRNACCTHTQKL